MKSLFLLIVPIVFTAASWIEFTSLEGRFQITAPGSLSEKTDTVSTSVGTLVYHTYYYEDKSQDAENLFYMVSYCDYPNGTIHKDSTELREEFFQATIDAAVESVHGKLLYVAESKLGEYPGMFWRIDYKNGKVIIKTKAYLVDNRYYAIQIISYAEKNINQSAVRFFDSFKLL